MNQIDFAAAFRALTDVTPFPWQQALFDRFLEGDIPASCNLPTGLGKTSVITVWLLALATEPTKIPRRLVYVVNRRTVVDQSTDEVKRIRDRILAEFGPPPEILWRLRQSLDGLCSSHANIPLAISTLRGQYADNREWSADPSRPAVICGTVDMIGSALLFSSYRAGKSVRPLHAGFLGQDVLLVHDEAHLEPAFQKLIEAIRDEQKKDGSHRVKPFHVMSLTATPRGTDQPFKLSDKDFENAVVKHRIHAVKKLRFHAIQDEKKETVESLVNLAQAHEGSDQAILVFVRSVRDAKEVRHRLSEKNKGKVALLVGPLRGFERDSLVRDPVFIRFLPKGDRPADVPPTPGTVFLVCTSAGEVGVNISADHLVCDLTPFDSMAQRLGRVNRFGEGAAWVDIVVPTEFGDDDQRIPRERTFELLKDLPSCGLDQYSGSPAAIETLLLQRREGAASPKPLERDTSDILFDAWSLTSIRDLPGCPPVVEYLHGIDTEESADTLFAWREEVGLLDLLLSLPPEQYQERLAELGEYLEEYQLEPHELLRERTFNARTQIKDIAKRAGGQPAWVIDGRGEIKVMTIESLAELEFGDLAGRTIVLPQTAGGLRDGILDGKAAFADGTRYDVADAFPGAAKPRRVRFLLSFSQTELAAGDEESAGGGTWKRIGYWSGEAIPSPTDADVTEHEGMARLNDLSLASDGGGNLRKLVAFVQPESAGDETRSRFAKEEQCLDAHLKAAEQFAAKFAAALFPEGELRDAIRLAAKWHDLGKDRQRWQNGIGNFKYADGIVLAKSGHNRRIKGLEGYRHEFGSLIDVEMANDPEFLQLSGEMKDLVRHLIAAHHGRGRPHFSKDEAFDSERRQSVAEKIAVEVPQRFARLQRKYGRWGLAYLESLVRAADILASKIADGGAK